MGPKYDPARDTEQREAIQTGRISTEEAYQLGRDALEYAARWSPHGGKLASGDWLLALQFAADVMPWALNGGGMKQLEMQGVGL
jgi:hypothetical protein